MAFWVLIHLFNTSNSQTCCLIFWFSFDLFTRGTSRTKSFNYFSFWSWSFLCFCIFFVTYTRGIDSSCSSSLYSWIPSWTTFFFLNILIIDTIWVSSLCSSSHHSWLVIGVPIADTSGKREIFFIKLMLLSVNWYIITKHSIISFKDIQWRLSQWMTIWFRILIDFNFRRTRRSWCLLERIRMTSF